MHNINTNFRERRDWTDEDWASRGYVFVNVHTNHSSTDRVPVKRKYKSPVITKHEKDMLMREGIRLHKEYIKRRAKSIERDNAINSKAMKPYIEQHERKAKEKRKRDIELGIIGLNEMTFFDMLLLDINKKQNNIT